MIAQLTPNGTKVPFSAISTGEPFFHHGRFWTRVAAFDGTDLCKDGMGSCSFYVDEDDATEGETPGWIEVEKVDVEYR